MLEAGKFTKRSFKLIQLWPNWGNVIRLKSLLDVFNFSSRHVWGREKHSLSSDIRMVHDYWACVSFEAMSAGMNSGMKVCIKDRIRSGGKKAASIKD